VKRGGTGCQHFDVGEVVGGDLEDAGRVFQPVDLVEGYTARSKIAEEAFGVFQQLCRTWQFTVEVFCARDRAGQGGLTGPPNSFEPHDGASAPGIFDQVFEKGSFYHDNALYK
jgi:hypothetical protein